MKTAMQELESLFYNEAQPTINTNSWVIHKEAFEKLILAAKEQEKKQIIEAHAFGADNVDSNGGLLLRGVKNAIYYYNQTYNKNKSFTYCQRQIEGQCICDKQCEHCKEYYAPLENQNK